MAEIAEQELTIVRDRQLPWVDVRLPEGMPFTAASLKEGAQQIRRAFPELTRVTAGYVAGQGTRIELRAANRDELETVIEQLPSTELQVGASDWKSGQLEFLYLDRDGPILEPTQPVTTEQVTAFFRYIGRSTGHDVACEAIVKPTHGHLLFSAASYDGLRVLTDRQWRRAVSVKFVSHGAVRVDVDFDKYGRIGSGTIVIKLAKGQNGDVVYDEQTALQVPGVQSVEVALPKITGTIFNSALKVEDPIRMCPALWPDVVRFAKALGVHPSHDAPFEIRLLECNPVTGERIEPTVISRTFPPVSNR